MEELTMKINKKSRNLVLSMALGDGYVNPKGFLSVRHSEVQKEYAEWKRQLLKSNGINVTELYTHPNNGYGAYEFRTYTHQFIKGIRKFLYTPSKNIGNRKVLNQLTPLGLAIWYMDDGGLAQKKRNGKIYANELMLNTLLSKEENQIIIDYFKEVWGINFSQCKNRGRYRLRCGTREARKFISIIKPYVEQVECMK